MFDKMSHAPCALGVVRTESVNDYFCYFNAKGTELPLFLKFELRRDRFNAGQ